MDLLSNALTQIRNANRAKNPTVTIPYIAQTFKITQILQQEGFIQSYTIVSCTLLQIQLKYTKHNQCILLNLKRISTPGRRIYIKATEIPSLFGGLGIYILSTSKGLLTNKEALKQKIGGELLCSIW
uniref:Small ribosomal subunit protein uS8c n=1 Tax=Codium arabicum TaxID=221038 RepID=A0A386B0K7_CODAR|nr:ribosomal protein S8 [Codium arabicum]AYC65231.1 ribosomal protein S8 [Codium arabicum]